MATLSREAYETLIKERTELLAKVEQAYQDGEEFLGNHYTRLLRVVNQTYHSAMKASINLENRELREKVAATRQKSKSDS